MFSSYGVRVGWKCRLLPFLFVKGLLRMLRNQFASRSFYRLFLLFFIHLEECDFSSSTSFINVIFLESIHSMWI